MKNTELFKKIIEQVNKYPETYDLSFGEAAWTKEVLSLTDEEAEELFGVDNDRAIELIRKYTEQ